MPKKMEFSRGVDDSTGVQRKKTKIVYSAEVRQKLDDVLATAKKAETDEERITALEEYKKKIESVAEEFKLVGFREGKIHNFELRALQKIVEQINEDYAGQRLADKSFGLEDMKIDDLIIEIENEKVVRIRLDGRMLTKIPIAVGELTNLQTLGIGGNQITEISGLDNLTNLQALGLDDNQITEISGLDNLTNLKELWLKDNQITEISGLDNLINLQKLWIDDNQITEISGLDNLINLQKLWILDNQISRTDEKIEKQIMALKTRKVSVVIFKEERT